MRVNAVLFGSLSESESHDLMQCYYFKSFMNFNVMDLYLKSLFYNYEKCIFKNTFHVLNISLTYGVQVMSRLCSNHTVNRLYILLLTMHCKCIQNIIKNTDLCIYCKYIFFN